MLGVSFRELEKVRRELEKYVRDSIAQVFGWTLTSSSSALGDTDACEKADAAQDPDGKKGQRQVVRVTPFGFLSRQPKGLRGLWLRLGASNVFFMGIGPQQKYGPQSLNVGETCVFNFVNGCQLLLDQSGAFTLTDQAGGTVKGDGTGVINITAAAGKAVNINAGAGANLVLNGGVLKVARVTDTVNGTAGPYPVSGVIASGAANVLG